MVSSGGMDTTFDPVLVAEGLTMDGDFEKLRGNYDRLLKEAARASVELQMAESGRSGVPHYREIELAAHRLIGGGGEARSTLSRLRKDMFAKKSETDTGLDRRIGRGDGTRRSL